MLHAVLHGKLDELTPEPQRLEDALTSTVFGTLVSAEAWHVLALWLGLQGAVDEAKLVGNDCWFWPRLAFAEPDVVLRIGDVLVVIEAKLRSGRNDLAIQPEVEENAGDQLLRQYKCIATPPDARVRYTDELESAISERRHLVQVFAVDARQRLLRKEVEESRRRLPDGADLRLITWQSLYALLNRTGQARWTKDLRAYLERLGLDTFEGIARRGGTRPARADAWQLVRQVRSRSLPSHREERVWYPLRPAPG